MLIGVSSMTTKKVLPFEPPAGTIIYDPEGREQPEPAFDEPQPNGKHSKIEPLPLAWFQPFDIASLPLRAWLHAGHYIRKHVVMTVAPGAWGKTSLVLINAIEMALGKGLIGPHPPKQLRVLYWNGEDPTDEIMRRIGAICLHYEIDMGNLRGHLVIGDKLKPERRFAFLDQRQQLQMRLDVLMQFEQFVTENKIDVVILDPLVNFHRVPEANNTAMEELVSTLSVIADRRDMCIELNHHTRKPQGNFEITVDDSRGAGAIANAARSVRVLNRMTAEEAKMPKITNEDRRHYLRVNRDKSNLIPASKASWLHLRSVALGNDPKGGDGDNVQVIERWDYPQPFDDVSADDMRWMRRQVQLEHYRSNPRSEDWVGHALAKHIGLDLDDKAERERVITILKMWFKNGVLATEQRPDAKRRMREFVVPGNWNENADDAAPVDTL